MDWLIGIEAWLGQLRDDPAGLRALVAGLLGVSVFTLLLAAYFLLGGLLDPLKKRIDTVKDLDSGRRTRGASIAPLLKKFGAVLTPKGVSRRQRIETMLRHAAFRRDGDAQLFHGIKLLLAILAPLAVIVGVVLTRVASPVDAIPYYLAAGALGFLLPDIVLRRLVLRRQERLRRGLPDALDLLVVCSEAGLGLGAGIQRVAREITITHPDLADEFHLVTMQTRAGMDNRAALKNLEERTGLDDIQALVTTLIQSMRFGTSVGDTLRIYSAELRDKRLQKAQEKAAKIGALVVFPLVTCIMPSFLLIVLGPAMLGLARAFSQMNF